MNIKIFINPFEKIAGLKSLLWGLLAILFASVVGYFSNTHFDGILNVHSGLKSSWLAHFSEPIISWLCISVWFYFWSIILSPSKIRAIDIFGTQAYAFIPMVPTSFSGFFKFVERLAEKFIGIDPKTITPDMLPVNEIVWASVLGLFIMFFVVWSAIWMYNGFKISSNLKNARLLPVYIVGLIFGMFVPKYIFSLIF